VKEVLNNIATILLIYASASLFFSIAIYIFQKDKIYRCPSNEWIDIKKHPIPNDIRGFIATDCKKVDYLYEIIWGPYGEVYFNKYNKTYVTYWQALPDVPKKD